MSNPDRMPPYWLVALFVAVSGFCSLVYQVVWERTLRGTFGGDSIFFFVIQAATACVLLLAANTAFNGFPLLGSVLARDSYAPKALNSRGDRLVFSNGMLILGSGRTSIRFRPTLSVGKEAILTAQAGSWALFNKPTQVRYMRSFLITSLSAASLYHPSQPLGALAPEIYGEDSERNAAGEGPPSTRLSHRPTIAASASGSGTSTGINAPTSSAT